MEAQRLTFVSEPGAEVATDAAAATATNKPGSGRRTSRTYLVATAAFLAIAALDTLVPATYVTGSWWLVLLLICLIPWPAQPFDTKHPVQLSWDALKQSMAVCLFGWLYFRANTALLDAAMYWKIPGLEGKLQALNFVLQDIAVGMTTAALLAWPLQRVFKRDAVRAAFVVATPWFILTCTDTVFDFTRWRDRPLSNALWLFEATFLPLLLMQACAILERRPVHAVPPSSIVTRPTLARLGALFDRCPRWFAPSIIQPILVLTMAGIGVRIYYNALAELAPAASSALAAIVPLCALLLTAATVHHFRKLRVERQKAGLWRRLSYTLDAAFPVVMLGLLWSWVLFVDAPLAEYYAKDALAAVPGPDWTIDYDARTQTLRLTGQYQYGIATAFAAELKKHPDALTVELEGPGGLQSEGMTIAERIETRGLSTRVTTECASACTMAFVAGKKRTLLKDASLGFHAVSSPIATIDLNEDADRFFASHGIDRAFIRRASKVPHEDMWYPTNDTLLAAHVVTEIR